MRSLRSRVAAGLAVGAALVTIPLTAGTASAEVSTTAPHWVAYISNIDTQYNCEGTAGELPVDPIFTEKYSDTKCLEEPDGEWTIWALTVK